MSAGFSRQDVTRQTGSDVTGEDTTGPMVLLVQVTRIVYNDNSTHHAYYLVTVYDITLVLMRLAVMECN